MARIAGVDLPPQKRLWVGLTSIYGIGQERAKKLAEKAGVDHTKKIRDLTEDEINHLRQEIEKEGRVEGDLRKEIQMNIRRLIEIQAYRGIRHRRNLPVRGQRSARKNSRRSESAASFRTVWCTSPRRSTTRRSPSRTRTVVSCAGPLRVPSASRDRARARRTPRSRPRWPPPAWRAISTG